MPIGVFVDLVAARERLVEQAGRTTRSGGEQHERLGSDTIRAKFNGVDGIKAFYRRMLPLQQAAGFKG